MVYINVMLINHQNVNISKILFFNFASYIIKRVLLPDELAYETYEKRGGLRPIPFPCNGRRNRPRCLHGGKGPRKTWTGSGKFCVCLCPTNWIGPECGYAASQSKRGYDELRGNE